VDAQQDPLIGQIFAEKYEIIDVLGEGGMSIVYKASTGTWIVLWPSSFCSHIWLPIRRLWHVSSTSPSGQLASHQNIVNCSRLRHDEDRAGLLCDGLPGRRDPCGGSRAQKTPAASGISQYFQTNLRRASSCTQEGVVHRDLKPSTWF